VKARRTLGRRLIGRRVLKSKQAPFWSSLPGFEASSRDIKATTRPHEPDAGASWKRLGGMRRGSGEGPFLHPREKKGNHAS